MNIDYNKLKDTIPELNTRLTLMTFGIDVDEIEKTNALSCDRALLLLIYSYLKAAGFPDSVLTLTLKLFLDEFNDIDCLITILDNQYLSSSKRDQAFDMETLKWVPIESDYIFMQLFNLRSMYERILKPLIIG